MKTVGVLGLQGDVIEHIDALRKLKAGTVWVKQPKQLKSIDALIIPGGESTTIGNLMVKNDLFDEIIDLGKNGMPIYGTCAGAILLAKRGDDQVRKTKQQLLKLMDMKVNRNAFGRQRESFEAFVDVKGVGELFHSVFIRAPVIEKVHGKCEPIAYLNQKIVAARQKNLLATCFHPELTDDLRVHKYFLEMI
ncbi:MAG: pyridoxal 5'-phosphate synthase glutaminase subunit PdxT [Candidatus Micrarchaeota archaeon]